MKKKTPKKTILLVCFERDKMKKIPCIQYFTHTLNFNNNNNNNGEGGRKCPNKTKK